MKKSRFTDEQIIGFLKQVEAGAAVKELGRKHGFSDASFYKWRSRFVSTKSMRALECASRTKHMIELPRATREVGRVEHAERDR